MKIIRIFWTICKVCILTYLDDQLLPSSKQLFMTITDHEEKYAVRFNCESIWCGHNKYFGLGGCITVHSNPAISYWLSKQFCCFGICRA